MRVEHIVWDIFERAGGGERASVAIARATSRTCESSLWSVHSGPDEFDRDGLTVRRIPRLFGTFDNPFPSPLALMRVIQGADVIHVHQMNTYVLDLVLATRRKSQAVVVTDYGGGGICLGRFFRFFNQVDAFTSYSVEMNELSYSGYTNIRQLPIPMNLPLGVVSVALYEGNAYGLKILCVGRILPHKGFEIAIAALSIGDHLTIIGHVEDERYFHWLLSLPSDGEVYFVHDADDEALVEAYLAADVFVSTSLLSDYEGHLHPKSELLSLVAIEAAWFGLPVIISSVVPALRSELLSGLVDGDIYEAGNVSHLRECLNRWRFSRLRNTNSSSIVQEKFGDQHVAAMYGEFYESVTSMRRSGKSRFQEP